VSPGDPNVEYWRDYDGLQKTKHQLLGRYLDAWFPILADFLGPVVYIDCHAGRGRHETGDAGSPLVALEHLLSHRLREQILRKSEVWFRFFELDAENAARLRTEVDAIGPLPSKVHIAIHSHDWASVLGVALDEIEGRGRHVGPALAFVDPFGFKLSMQLMNRFLRAGKTELLVNFMSRYVDMALQRPEMEPILDDLFGTRDWRDLRVVADPDNRYEETVGLFARNLSALHVTRVVMRDLGGRVKYTLFHATNHPYGRRVFKDAIWKTIPDGSFTAFERDRLEQGLLIGANINPPLGQVLDLLERVLAGREVRLHEDVYPLIDRSNFRLTHAHDAIKMGIRTGRVHCVSGRFVIKDNPVLRFG
jgi:three-Cys-motif partner protein